MKKTKQKRSYVNAPRVIDVGIPCPHCSGMYDHIITNVYPNGNRRRICGSCEKPFVTMQRRENITQLINK